MAHKWYDGSWTSPQGAALEDWPDANPGPVNRPAVCSSEPGTLDVVWRDSGDRLYRKRYRNGWQQVEPIPVGEPVASDPTIAALGPDNIHIFWQQPNHELRHKWWHGGAWLGEESLGGNIWGSPAAVSMTSGVVDIFATTTNGDLVHRWYDGRWHPWRTRESGIADPAVCSWGDGRLDAIVVNSRGELLHGWRTEAPYQTHRDVISTVDELMQSYSGPELRARQRALFSSASLGAHCSGSMISPHLFMTASHCGGPGQIDVIRFFHNDHLGDPDDDATIALSAGYVARALPWQHSGIASNVEGERGDTILMWVDDGPDGVPPGIRYGYLELSRREVNVGDPGYSVYRNAVLRRDDVQLYSKGTAISVNQDRTPFQGPSIDYDIFAVGGVSGSTTLAALGDDANQVVGVTQGATGRTRTVPKVTEFLRRFDADNNAVVDAVDYDWLITRPPLDFRLLDFTTPLQRSHWVAVPHGSAVGFGPMGTLLDLPTMSARTSANDPQLQIDGYWHQTSRFRGGLHRISLVASGETDATGPVTGYVRFHSDSTGPEQVFSFTPTGTPGRFTGTVDLGQQGDYRLILGVNGGSKVIIESLSIVHEGTPIGFRTFDERRAWEFLGKGVIISRGINQPTGFAAILEGGEPWGLRNRHLALLPRTRYDISVPARHRAGDADGYFSLTDLDGAEVARHPLTAQPTGSVVVDTFSVITPDRTTTAVCFGTNSGRYLIGDLTIVPR